MKLWTFWGEREDRIVPPHITYWISTEEVKKQHKLH